MSSIPDTSFSQICNFLSVLKDLIGFSICRWIFGRYANFTIILLSRILSIYRNIQNFKWFKILYQRIWRKRAFVFKKSNTMKTEIRQFYFSLTEKNLTWEFSSKSATCLARSLDKCTSLCTCLSFTVFRIQSG